MRSWLVTTTATTTLAGTTAPAGSATSSTLTTGPAKVPQAQPRHRDGHTEGL